MANIFTVNLQVTFGNAMCVPSLIEKEGNIYKITGKWIGEIPGRYDHVELIFHLEYECRLIGKGEMIYYSAIFETMWIRSN